MYIDQIATQRSQHDPVLISMDLTGRVSAGSQSGDQTQYGNKSEQSCRNQSPTTQAKKRQKHLTEYQHLTPFAMHFG